MPLYAERPIVHVVPSAMHGIKTHNPEDLFGLWLVFSKCSPAMEDGRRYENMAWRLWGRESFCCGRDHIIGSSQPESDIPELSSSVASDDSFPESAITTATRSNSSFSRPHLRRHDSTNSQARGSHITPNELEKVVNSIREKKELKHPIPTLPRLSQTLPERMPSPPTTPLPTTAETATEDITPRPSSPPASHFIPEPSAATLANGMESNGSPVVGSDTSASTDTSSHSVVHGFEPGRISTSHRSTTLLVPTPILKTGSQMRPQPSAAKPTATKKPMFQLGASSDEDGSSFENSMVIRNSPMVMRSSLSDTIKRSGNIKKTASFSQHVSTMTMDPISSGESEDAIATDSEDDDSEDENAIEEDDSEAGWEDDDDNNESVPSSMNDKQFQRVDSRPLLTSKPSLLTTALHEKERAHVLQNMASRSTPAIRRSRTSTPNGPSTGNSPQEDSGLMMRQVPRSKPIIMTTSNVHPPALSPRTTRRNMLQTELTQSLRQNLLWERQQKNATTNAVNKRHQSAVSIPALLRRAATTNDIKGLQGLPQQNINKAATFKETAKNPSSYNDYFDQGLQEYHQKGW